LTKIYSKKKNFDQKLSPPERTYKPQKKPSALKRELPAFQNMKFLNFYLLGVIFALLEPDPDSESGYGPTFTVGCKKSIFINIFECFYQ
jgi:hypothetical protein